RSLAIASGGIACRGLFARACGLFVRPGIELAGWLVRALHRDARVGPRMHAVAMLVAIVVAALGMTHADDARGADWRATISADPHVLVLDPDALYVRVSVSEGQSLEGNALIDDVRRADLDGDGQPEAIIKVDSGGTSGVVGVLIYRLEADGPRLV